MSLVEIPFSLPPYSSDISGVGGDDAINVRIEIAGEGARAQKFFVHTPALKLFSVQTVAGASRGMWTTSEGRVFQCAGAQLCEIFSDGTRTVRGAITNGQTACGMTDNGQHLVVMDGSKGWTLNLGTNVFSQITDLAFPNGAVQCWFLDQYILCIEPNTLYFRWSDLADATVWPALNRAAAEGVPDNITCLAVNAREVWVGGPKSFEVFYDTGEADNTFARIQGAVIEVGTIAPASLDAARGNVFFLGGGEAGAGRVWMSRGLEVTPISTKGIEGLLAQSTDLSTSFGKCHTFAGNTLYVLTVPSIDKTLVYDLDLGVWHERAWMVPNTGALTRWRGQWSTFGHQRVLLGDSFGNAVYELSESQYEDDKPDGSGTWTIKRRRTTPYYEQDRKLLKWLEIELQAVVGRGTTTGQGSDPEVMIRWSNDGLQWSNERRAFLGALGNRQTRCRLLSLGLSRLRQYRIEQSDPVPVCWQKLFARIEAGSR